MPDVTPADIHVACWVRANAFYKESTFLYTIQMDEIKEEEYANALVNWTTDWPAAWPYQISAPLTGIYQIWAKVEQRYGIAFLESHIDIPAEPEVVLYVWNNPSYGTVQSEHGGAYCFSSAVGQTCWMASYGRLFNYVMPMDKGARIELQADDAYEAAMDNGVYSDAEIYARLVAFDGGINEDEIED